MEGGARSTERTPLLVEARTMKQPTQALPPTSLAYLAYYPRADTCPSALCRPRPSPTRPKLALPRAPDVDRSGWRVRGQLCCVIGIQMCGCDYLLSAWWGLLSCHPGQRWGPTCLAVLPLLFGIVAHCRGVTRKEVRVCASGFLKLIPRRTRGSWRPG